MTATNGALHVAHVARAGPEASDLTGILAQVAPAPLFFINAGSIPGEIPVNQVYAEASDGPVELWNLPEVSHTNAIVEVSAEYERRVIEHLNRTLLR